MRLVRSESVQSEFAHACLMSFLFSFRVPSESLQLRRSFRNDRLSGIFAPFWQGTDRNSFRRRPGIPGG